jgi:bidirectional [NiFe] hydrogenase diaphorase subunit
MQLTIDGKRVGAEAGETLLTVARRSGVGIPTLCHHEALEPRGACRLCTVEITNPKWPGWKRLVASCVYPAEADLVVETKTPEVVAIRRTLVDLLLARCPETPAIQQLGKAYGLEETSYRKRAEDDRCILCGQCVRVCQDAIGAAAIGLSGRGAVKKVGPAYGEPSERCIGCGACARVCPTGAIPVEDRDGRRTIWGRTFDLVRCGRCGAPTLPRQQIEHQAARAGLEASSFDLCVDCRRLKTAAQLDLVMGR